MGIRKLKGTHNPSKTTRIASATITTIRMASSSHCIFDSCGYMYLIRTDHFTLFQSTARMGWHPERAIEMTTKQPETYTIIHIMSKMTTTNVQSLPRPIALCLSWPRLRMSNTRINPQNLILQLWHTLPAAPLRRRTFLVSHIKPGDILALHKSQRM